MRFVNIAVLLLAASTVHAQMMATLVRQYIGRSVTGAEVVVCVYRAGSQTFEQAMPWGSMCAPSIMVR